MNLFSSAGMMVKIPSQDNTSNLIQVWVEDDYTSEGIFNWESRMGVTTAITTDETSLMQVRQMFNNKLYLNVFGDNPGMMNISGMYSAGICTDEGYSEGYSGFELISSYYRQHRASNKMLPISIAIGGQWSPMIYWGFLVKCQMGATDPQLQIGQFSWSLVYPIEVPPFDAEDSGGFGDDVGDFPNPGPPSPGDNSAAIDRGTAFLP